VYGRRREINTHWDLFIGIRNHLGESATGQLARYDVNNDGNIDLRDLTKARIPPELPSYQPWGFQGRIRCSYKTSGASPQTVTVYDFRARFYDPTHGRFLQRDPAEYADSYNLYLAFLGNPLISGDPTGLTSYLDIAATGGVVGMLMGALGSALHGGTIDDILAGAVGGGVAGLVGAPAFAFLSGAGVLGCMVAGGTAGVAGGFVESYVRSRDLEAALTDSFVGGMIGTLTGGLGYYFSSASRSAWRLTDPFARGKAFHTKGAGNLPFGFKTFDNMDWQTGLATSKKSLDLRDPTYRDTPKKVYSKVTAYMRETLRFTRWHQEGMSLSALQIRAREIELLVPPGSMTSAQWMELQRASQYGQQHGVALRIVETW